MRRRGCRGGRKQRASQMQRKHWPGSAGPKGKLSRRTKRRLNQMQGSIHEGGDADKQSGDDEYEDLQDDELEQIDEPMLPMPGDDNEEVESAEFSSMSDSFDGDDCLMTVHGLAEPPLTPTY